MKVLTQRERAEKEARKQAILKEKAELEQKTKLHRENPTKEGNEELKQLITRAKDLANELKDIESELLSDDVLRESQNIVIKENEGGNQMNINNMNTEQLRGSTVYRDAFYKKLFEPVLRKQNLFKGLTEKEQEVLRAVTDMDGGSIVSGSEYLIPLTTVNKIHSILTSPGVVWDLLPKTNLKGNIDIPIGARTGQTVNEHGVAQLQYTFTDLAIKQTAIVAEIKVQNLLLANAIEDLEDYLAREAAKYLREQLDFKVLHGDGDFFDGILDLTTPEKYGDNITYAKVMEAEGSLKQAYANGARFLMSRKTYYTKFKTMTDPNGNLLASTIPFTSNGIANTMYLVDGVPCDHTDDMADGEFLLWNPNYYIVNVSKNITLSINTSIYENEDKTALFAKIYAGGRALFPQETIRYYQPGV